MSACRIVLVTFGTLGDLHPFIGLAQALRRCGADPLLAAASEYRSRVEGAGVAFVALSPGIADIHRDLGWTHQQITRRAVTHPRFLFDKLVFPYLDRAFEEMQSVLGGADLVVVSSLSFAARIAAEQRGIPWMTVILQPMMFLSPTDPPVIAGASMLSAALRRLGPRVATPVLRGLKWLSRPMFAPVERLRRRVGLKPTFGHPLFEGQFGGGGAIALYSPLLGAIPTEARSSASQAGFCWFDGTAPVDGGMPQGLRAFLDEGDPPIVFTLGSSMVHDPGRFYAHSIDAARALGRRAVVLIGEDVAEPEISGDAGRPFLYATPYARHSDLFPRAAAIVHHGGIGTLAQALRSGRPQLIVPFFADQPDNAERARRLGVGRVIRPRDYCVARVVRDLGSLLDDSSVATRAAEVAALVARETGAATAAAAILQAATESRSRRPPRRTDAASIA